MTWDVLWRTYQDGADVGVTIKLAEDFIPAKVWMV